MTIDNECRKAADATINALEKEGHDYSAKREDLAILFARLWQGNWDCTTAFQDGTPDLRFIQEDEYDQHLSDGPDIDSQLCFTKGHYVFFSIDIPRLDAPADEDRA
jgi:hypothetical protein